MSGGQVGGTGCLSRVGGEPVALHREAAGTGAPGAPSCRPRPHLFHSLPQPEWQHRLWPLLAPRAGGQWSILVPRVAGEPEERRRGWGWGRVCWLFFSRLDGQGSMGRALWDSRGGRFLTTAGWGEKKFAVFNKLYLSGPLKLGSRMYAWPESQGNGIPSS